MKVALIHLKMYVKAYHFFPLGIGHLASALEKKSVDYSFYDLHKNWLNTSQFIKKIKKEGPPDLFAISALITSYPIAVEICKAIKLFFPKSKIALGGRISVLRPEFMFKKIATDYVIKGEGEVALIELIECLEGKKDLSSVRGLAYKNEVGKVRSNGEAALIEDVSEYSIPYKNLDISRYISKKTVQSPNLRSINMLSGRGCPYSCTFCNFSKEENHRMRYYDIDKLSDAWDYLMNFHGLKHVTFNDDIFTVDKKRVRKLCTRLKERQLAFSCSTRLDRLDEEMISILEDSGCRFLCLGIESPVPAVAKIIDKRLNLDRCQKNIDLLKRTRITMNFGFMFGYLGETEDTIKQTREFIIKNDMIYSAFFATPFPETKLYDMVRNKIPNEEVYLKKLSTVDLSSDYLINMTDIPKKRLYRLRDHLVADSLLNVMKIKFPALKYVMQKLFVLYLIFMRKLGIKSGIFKRLFEFVNIVVIKPLASIKNKQFFF